MRVDKNARQYRGQNTAQDNCASNSIIPNSTRPSSSDAIQTIQIREKCNYEIHQNAKNVKLTQFKCRYCVLFLANSQEAVWFHKLAAMRVDVVWLVHICSCCFLHSGDQPGVVRVVVQSCSFCRCQQHFCEHSDGFIFPVVCHQAFTLNFPPQTLSQVEKTSFECCCRKTACAAWMVAFSKSMRILVGAHAPCHVTCG